jgi:hypothetical protein
MIFFYSGESVKDDAYEAGGNVPRATLLSFFNMSNNSGNKVQLAAILKERKSKVDRTDLRTDNRKRKKAKRDDDQNTG